jgi:hypothetical protein
MIGHILFPKWSASLAPNGSELHNVHVHVHKVVLTKEHPLAPDPIIHRSFEHE